METKFWKVIGKKKKKLILANVFGMFLVINLRLFEVLMTSFWYKIVNRVSSVVLKRYHTENMVWWIVLYNMYMTAYLFGFESLGSFGLKENSAIRFKGTQSCLGI